MPKQLQLYSAARSEVGNIRDNNEDSFLSLPELGLFAVADGMGGAAAGEVASQLTMEGLTQAAQHIPDEAFLQDASLEGRQQIFDWIKKTCTEINSQLQAKIRADRSLRGMGCTLELVLFRGNGVFLSHTGDSRCYLVRQGTLYQLTEDHNLGQEMLASGAFTEEQVLQHPQRNVLTRVLGPHPRVEPDTAYFEIGPGDTFLLCSDGLHDELDAETILRLLCQEPSQATDALVQAALEAGGRDNITSVVVNITECEAAPVIIGSERARAALSRSSLFGALTPSELMRVQRIATGKQFAPGEPLIQEGQLCDFILLNIEGEHSVWRDGQKVGAGGPGDPLGELSMVPAPAFVTVRAETPVTALQFPFSQLHSLLSTDATICAKISMAALSRMSQRMKSVVDSLARYRKAYGPTPPE